MSFRRYPSGGGGSGGDVNVHDAAGNDILSTIDSYTLKNGLDVNLLSSGIIADVNGVMNPPFSNAAMSVGFLNGGTLVTPAMNVTDNSLIVDATQKGNIPVTIAGSSVAVTTSLDAVLGTPIGSTNPVPAVLVNPSSGANLTTGGGVPDGNTLRVINVPSNGVGTTQDFNTGTYGAATPRVVIASNNPKLSVYTADYQTTGTITGTGNVSLAVDGSGTVGAQISGSWTGNITIEGSLDNVTWYGTPSIALTSGGPAYNFSTNNIFQINVSGLKYIRLRGNTVTGTATVTLVANQGVGVVMLENSIPSGTNTIGSIANITGTVSLPTGAATAASQTNVQSAPGSSAGTAITVQGSATGVAIPTSVASLPLPTGAATSALQTTGNSSLSSIDAKTPSLGSASSSASQPVVIANDQIVPTSPNGQAVFGSISALNGSTTLSSGGYTACVIDIRGTFTATVSFQGTIDGANWIALQGIPYGSAQNTNLVTSSAAAGAWLVQSAGCAQVRAIATAYTSGTITTVLRATPATSWTYNAPVGTTNAISVASGTLTSVATVTTLTGITNTVTVKQTSAKGEFVRSDYTVTPVTTAAYTQLIASTASAYSAIEIFDSSGQTLKLAIGAAASEVDQFIIFPGGNGRIPFTLATGQRISIKALSATANVGEIDINFYV
jgi:hypothetical protein